MFIREASRKTPRVLLLNMPWGRVTEPNLAPFILKAALERDGIACDVIALNARLLRHITHDTYNYMVYTWGLHDFIFTQVFEPEVSPEQVAAIERVLAPDEYQVLTHFRRGDHRPSLEAILKLRQEVIPRFLDEFIAETPLQDYDLIGFSCLLGQTISSIATATRIRQLYPRIPLAFGGYALHKPVGEALQRAFPCMDVVAYGEGEPIIGKLARACVGQIPIHETPGISYRDPDGRICFTPPARRMNLDDSPAPDFSDYFDELDDLHERHAVRVQLDMLPLETSRGCWWGEKKHCVFCGVDDETLRYSKKSPDIVLDQLEELRYRYGVDTIRFADLIFPTQFFKTLMPRLEGRGYHFFYEAKASVTAAQVAAWGRAGMFRVLIGVESLSTPVLRRMDKGTTTTQNIFCIRQLMKEGIQPDYNILLDFPNDTAEDYREMLALLPSLYHLQPPGSVNRVLFNRYAPLVDDPARFGLNPVQREHYFYTCVFSDAFLRETGLRLTDYCYYYHRPPTEDPELKSLYACLQHLTMFWQLRFRMGVARLSFETSPEGELVVRDNRFSEELQTTRFSPLHQAVYAALDDALLTPQNLSARLDLSADETARVLADLETARLVIQEEGRVLALAFPSSFYQRIGVGPQAHYGTAGLPHKEQRLDRATRHERAAAWRVRARSDRSLALTASMDESDASNRLARVDVPRGVSLPIYSSAAASSAPVERP